MRKFPLISITLFGLTMSLGVVACDGDDGNDDAADGDTTGDGDGDPTTGDGDGDGDPTTGDGDGDGCFEAPPECLQFVECLGAILPDQQAGADAQFGADGSCWCGTEDEAIACYETCAAQLDSAIQQNPTVVECHGQYCPIEELDPTQPYGPPEGGACPDWNGGQQLVASLGQFPGEFCSPACGGVAKTCPEHTQTVAQGTCGITLGGVDHCYALCYVDPFAVMNSTQCQCGATCQPGAGTDGDGNMRGICTYE